MNAQYAFRSINRQGQFISLEGKRDDRILVCILVADDLSQFGFMRFSVFKPIGTFVGKIVLSGECIVELFFRD